MFTNTVISCQHDNYTRERTTTCTTRTIAHSCVLCMFCKKVAPNGQNNQVLMRLRKPQQRLCVQNYLDRRENFLGSSFLCFYVNSYLCPGKGGLWLIMNFNTR